MLPVLATAHATDPVSHPDDLNANCPNDGPCPGTHQRRRGKLGSIRLKGRGEGDEAPLQHTPAEINDPQYSHGWAAQHRKWLYHEEHRRC